MLKMKKEKLTKKNYFPLIQPQLIKKENNFFKKILKFWLFLRKYQLMDDYIIWCEYLKRFIFIPKSFIYDGASVPKLLNGIFGTTGVLFFGALPHDFGYNYNGLLLLDDILDGFYQEDCPSNYEIYFKKFSKNELDKIFRELCTQESGMKFGSYVATFALTLFGFFDWNRKRKNKSKLNRDFPQLFF